MFIPMFILPCVPIGHSIINNTILFHNIKQVSGYLVRITVDKIEFIVISLFKYG